MEVSREPQRLSSRALFALGLVVMSRVMPGVSDEQDTDSQKSRRPNRIGRLLWSTASEWSRMRHAPQPAAGCPLGPESVALKSKASKTSRSQSERHEVNPRTAKTLDPRDADWDAHDRSGKCHSGSIAHCGSGHKTQLSSQSPTNRQQHPRHPSQTDYPLKSMFARLPLSELCAQVTR